MLVDRMKRMRRMAVVVVILLVMASLTEAKEVGTDLDSVSTISHTELS